MNTAPLCPFCYNGIVVEDNNMPGIFFCTWCHSNIKIPKFKDREDGR